MHLVIDATMLLSFRMKRRYKVANSWKLHTSLTVLGTYQSLIALTFSSLTCMPSAPTKKPKKSSLSIVKLHFSNSHIVYLPIKPSTLRVSRGHFQNYYKSKYHQNIQLQICL
jgi:hypothetical protein